MNAGTDVIILTGHITDSLVSIVSSGTWGKLNAADKKTFDEIRSSASTRSSIAELLDGCLEGCFVPRFAVRCAYARGVERCDNLFQCFVSGLEHLFKSVRQTGFVFRGRCRAR